MIPAASETLHIRVILAVAKELLTPSEELRILMNINEWSRNGNVRGRGEQAARAVFRLLMSKRRPVHTCWSVCGCTAEPPSTLQWV